MQPANHGRMKDAPTLVGQITSHLRDDQIPSPSDLWSWPPNRLCQNKPCCTELRFFSAMARRLQSCLKQSSSYAVSLANSGCNKRGRPHDPNFYGQMRATLVLCSRASQTPPRLNIMG